MNDETARLLWKLEAVDNASTTFARVGRSVDNTGKQFTNFGNTVKKVSAIAATAIAAVAAGAAWMALNFVKSAVDAAGKFETSMNVMQAALDATGKKMQMLEKFALRMGSKTVFSAQESADAMIELAKAGLTPAEIKAGALEATMAVAATEGLNLADAATTMANTMSSFSIKAEDAAKVADILAGASTASTASVDSLRQALAQVGPGAQNAGLSLNETVAALAAFDAAGIKGSDAGTSLKTMLARLVPTTETAAGAMNKLNIDFTNADGSFKSLSEISEILADKMGNLSEEQRVLRMQQIFGSDATRAATVLMKEGAEGLEEYIKATKDSGAAARMARARMKGWEGGLELLGGAFETLKIKLGRELLPMLSKFVRVIANKAIPWIENRLIPAVKKFTRWIQEEAVPFVREDLIPALEDLVEMYKSMADGMSDATREGKELWRSLNKLWDQISRITEGQGDFNTALTAIEWGFRILFQPVNALLGVVRGLIDGLNWILEHAPSIGDALGGIGDAVSGGAGWVVDQVTGRAAGGDIKRAAAGATLVGEHGPELLVGGRRVIPHSRTMGMRGGGTVINIHGAIDPVGTARQIERILAKGGRAAGRGMVATA